MNKPYTDVFYLSYTGIIQSKKFNQRIKNDNEDKKTTKKNHKISSADKTNTKNSGNDQNTSVHCEKHYKLNKSKVRARAIAFSRLKKSQKNFFFYTISFPSQLPDNQCFEVFNIALTRLRKEEMIQDYLWITERQKNGTLHFHILTNDLFSVQALNKFVRKSLINKCLRKEFSYDLDVLKKYNGVDIAKNRMSGKVKNFAKEKCKQLIISYLTKYITKNDIEFYRLPFHSSHSIAGLRKSVQVSDYEALMIFREYDSTNTHPKKIHNDWYTWFGFSNSVKEEAFEILDMYNELIYNKLPIIQESSIVKEWHPAEPKIKRVQLTLF